MGRVLFCCERFTENYMLGAVSSCSRELGATAGGQIPSLPVLAGVVGFNLRVPRCPLGGCNYSIEEAMDHSANFDHLR